MTDLSNSSIKSFVERAEAIEQERRDRAEDLRELMSEAKEAGLNVKAIRALVRRRMMTSDQRVAADDVAETLEQYVASLGEFGLSPLGAAAIERKRAEA